MDRQIFPLGRLQRENRIKGAQDKRGGEKQAKKSRCAGIGAGSNG